MPTTDLGVTASTPKDGSHLRTFCHPNLIAATFSAENTIRLWSWRGERRCEHNGNYASSIPVSSTPLVGLPFPIEILLTPLPFRGAGRLRLIPQIDNADAIPSRPIPGGVDGAAEIGENRRPQRLSSVARERALGGDLAAGAFDQGPVGVAGRDGRPFDRA